MNVVKVLFIFLIYLATVPTNVMCLGAFTESWLVDFGITRKFITHAYLLSTFGVFLSLVFFRFHCSVAKVFCILGWCSLIFVFISKSCISTTGLFAMFFIFQWLGQGYLVSICRKGLWTYTKQNQYSCWVGLLEASGTLAVFLYPFLLLWAMRFLSWSFIYVILAGVYFTFSFTSRSLSIERPSLKWSSIWKDVRFVWANVIIYLPVMLTSGLFFHLEAFCQHRSINIVDLGQVACGQAIGIVLGQILLGSFCRCNEKIMRYFFVILFFSQVLWCYALWQAKIFTSMLCGIVGWSLFGILVNVTWPWLYKNRQEYAENAIEASVVFGFLANSIGPVLFYFFV